MQQAQCFEVSRMGKRWGLMAGLSGVTACQRVPSDRPSSTTSLVLRNGRPGPIRFREGLFCCGRE